VGSSIILAAGHASSGHSTTTILAVVAIGVSALTLLWTIFWSVYTHRRATRPRLTVRTVFSVPVDYANQLGRAAIDMTAANTGPVTVSVTGAAIEVKGKSETVVPVAWVVQTPAPLPRVLAPGDHWNGLVDAGMVLESLGRRYGPREKWKIRAVVHDPAGNKYRPRKWMTLDVGAVRVFADGNG
jgi:hypothetical protein